MENDKELERLLRKAPAPAAPASLEARLIEQVSLPRRNEAGPLGWFWVFQQQSWAPRLAMFAILVGLIATLAFQQNTLSHLKAEEEKLASGARIQPAINEMPQQSPLEREFQELQKQAVELQALRAEMTAIDKLLTQQPSLAQESQALRSELARLTQNDPAASPEIQAALAEARKKADRIKCVNNLKNVGLAARIWAIDNKAVLPMDYVAMKNELSTPKLLICPADPARAVDRVQTWEQFASLGGSYELLSPGVSELLPTVVYARCPFHNNVVLADGSVHQLKSDQQLVQRNGYLEIKQ